MNLFDALATASDRRAIASHGSMPRRTTFAAALASIASLLIAFPGGSSSASMGTRALADKPLMPAAAGVAVASAPASMAPSSAPAASATTACLPETLTLTDRDGNQRFAVVHSPPGATHLTALVVALHGHGGDGHEIEQRSELDALADQEGFTALYPTALSDSPTWGMQAAWDLGFGPDVDAIVAFVDRAIRLGCVDPRRVYATGFSLGGGMANVLACRRADIFAAVAPVSGIYGSDWIGSCLPSRPVPVMAVHGIADPVLHYDGGLIDAFGFMDRPTEAVPEWAAAWAQRDGCQPRSADHQIGPDVIKHSWPRCAADVVLYAVRGGGHAWPGGAHNDPESGYATNTISASELMWSFFKERALP